MRQSSGLLKLVGEMVSIVVLALTGRFISFAQTTLESGVPLTIDRTLSHFSDILLAFTRIGNLGLLLAILIAASLIRIAITHANRSVLVGLRERAGIAQELTWSQRALRLPFAALYRTLNGVATFIGAIALAICFRLLNPESLFGLPELAAYAASIANGMTYSGIGALLLLFALYGLALAVIGYIASPAILSLEELASGCRPRRQPPGRPRSFETASV